MTTSVPAIHIIRSKKNTFRTENKMPLRCNPHVHATLMALTAVRTGLICFLCCGGIPRALAMFDEIYRIYVIYEHFIATQITKRFN